MIKHEEMILRIAKHPRPIAKDLSLNLDEIPLDVYVNVEMFEKIYGFLEYKKRSDGLGRTICFFFDYIIHPQEIVNDIISNVGISRIDYSKMEECLDNVVYTLVCSGGEYGRILAIFNNGKGSIEYSFGNIIDKGRFQKSEFIGLVDFAGNIAFKNLDKRLGNTYFGNAIMSIRSNIEDLKNFLVNQLLEQGYYLVESNFDGTEHMGIVKNHNNETIILKLESMGDFANVILINMKK